MTTANTTHSDVPVHGGAHPRTTSMSQISEASQTAQEFISSQLQLEADAREALPYQFDACTRPLGSMRQSLFSCLTCNPPPADLSEPYRAAGLCYSCSISCHGEHQLVELFTRRNFICDCGTTRLPSTSPCALRLNTATGIKGDVHSEKPVDTNTYNQNFRNRFCGCRQDYDAHNEKGTMYQCIGLATEEEGGCGEDWWHPECIMGLRRDWFLKEKDHDVDETIPTKNMPVETKLEAKVSTSAEESKGVESNGLVMGDTDAQPRDAPVKNDTGTTSSAPPLANSLEVKEAAPQDAEHPIPPGFPAEDDFELFICYKCTTVHPWIKRYAGTSGFLAAVPFPNNGLQSNDKEIIPTETKDAPLESRGDSTLTADTTSRKRKADEDNDDFAETALKKTKSEDQPTDEPTSHSPLTTASACVYNTLPSSPKVPISLFLRPTFRDHLCHCPIHFPLLPPHPALLEEEESYEPPLSAGSASENDNDDNHSVGSRSLLDRGEAALSNIDRVRAIEGVMAYNHIRDKVKDFLKPFAESGTAVGAEDVKRYFEKLRGDDEAIRRAREGGGGGGGEGEGEGERRGQAGY